jgi:hypothetical protein
MVRQDNFSAIDRTKREMRSNQTSRSFRIKIERKYYYNKHTCMSSRLNPKLRNF